jgi:acetolactate synthase-1/2/3 large subunit
MNVADAVASVLAAEGVERLFGYPLNPVLESAAEIGIRPVLARQERTGVYMADAVSRISAGDRVGVFCMQLGPGAENAYGAVAQAYADSVPLVVIPMGYEREKAGVDPNFDAAAAYEDVTKSAERVVQPETVPEALRRAFSRARNGRPRPTLVEIPYDMFDEAVPGFEYEASARARPGPDPAAVERAATLLLDADRPVLYAGQGVHYAEAWEELRALAELLEAPVATSLGGKSAFPEDHPLSLGAGGRSMPAPVSEFVGDADLLFGVGCSFTDTHYGIDAPDEPTLVHATLDPADLHKDVAADHALVGDAALVLGALTDELTDRIPEEGRDRFEAVAERIDAAEAEWLADWEPKLDSDEVPLTPYRVIRDLLATVPVGETVITHDAGSPRDQLAPFWKTTEPLTYLGWGKSTQLGYGLGLAMGAKLARPDALCINVWGDAAIGHTGMDLETAVREEIPILSILFNNFSMAMEVEHMPVSTERYGSTDITGNYAAMMEALGGYGERVREPEAIVPAIERGIERTEEGTPALLEFLTRHETEYPVP